MGRIKLSRREQEVAALVAEGLTNRQIAKQLFIAERTAEFHVEQIRNKLGFRSRVEIAGWFKKGEVGGPRAPGNLPVQLTSFVGREREIAQVKRLLARNRLVTLAGPPGIGKTRLALQVAGEIAERYRGGSWLIELGPMSDGNHVVQAVARVFDVQERPGEALEETVVSGLRQRQALLLLDNCEHLLDAAAHLAESLLRACPELRILVTSRQPLRAPGEAIYRLPPLAEAERLFCDRAAQSAPDFEWTPTVAIICRYLDAVPLAIELAAARVSLMSVDDLAAGLTHSLHLLTSGTRTAARRQQSLKAAIDWSHDLLAPDERLLFARLSVFVGGFRLDAAEAVCGDGGTDVAELVLGLADKSILWRLAAPDGPTRYRMLETVRQYAAERLTDSGADDRTRRLHFEFYLKWAESQGGPPVSHPQQDVLDRFEEEIANIRGALTWSRTHEPDGHLQLAFAATQYWLVRGSTVEGRAWLEPALAASADRGHTRADALWVVGMMTGLQGDLAASRVYNGEAIDLYRRLGDWAQLARVLNNLAVITDDPASIQRLLSEGLESARRSRDPSVLGLLLSTCGIRLRADGQADAAQKMLEESLALRRLAAHEWGIARSLLMLAHLSLDQSDRASARVHLEEALELVRRLGDGSGLADIFDAFARRTVEPVRALRLTAAARALRERAGGNRFVVGSPELEERLRSARQQMGQEAEAVEAAGHAMNLDEAVAEALGGE